MPSIPVLPPSCFFAGDSVKWSESSAHYPASEGWGLLVNISNANVSYASASSVDSSGNHLFFLPSSETVAFLSGEYRLVVSAVRLDEHYTLYAYDVTVKPNPSLVADHRSHVKKTLDALNAWIESREQGVSEYQIAGRTMKYVSLPDLLLFREKYQSLYQREQQSDALKSGRSSSRRLLVRMT